MGRFRRVRALVVVGVVLLAVGLAAWWALPQFWSPPQAPGIGAIRADSPWDNLMSSSSSSEPSSKGAATTSAESEAAGLGLVQERGRLVLEIDGDRMGEEIYQLSRRPNGGVELVSRGRFSLKVWFATVSFDYTQRVQMDTGFHPERYRLDLNGPLGVGSRRIRAEVTQREARIRRGSALETVSLPDGGPVAFIGVLASYAFTPKLIADRDRQRLTAIVFDVRRAEPAPEENAVPTVPLAISKQGSARLDSVAGDQSIDTFRYRLDIGNEPGADLTMYAQDGTFIGLSGRFSADSPPFRIYRADRLPGGFTVASVP